MMANMDIGLKDSLAYPVDPLGTMFEFDHTNKWYMHNPESVLENKTHKILLDFEIQTDYQISAR